MTVATNIYKRLLKREHTNVKMMMIQNSPIYIQKH